MYQNTLTDDFAAQFFALGRKGFEDGLSIDMIKVNPMILDVFSEESQKSIRSAVAQGWMDAASERVAV